jgi:hypothetical protein
VAERDEQRGLEERLRVVGDAEQDHEGHGVHVQGVDREHAIGRVRAA